MQEQSKARWGLSNGILVGLAALVVLGALAFFYIMALLPAMLVVWLVLAAVGALAVWVWALLDCAMNEASTGNDKVVWTMIIIFTAVVGAVLYLRFRRPVRIAELGR
jgi:hypothetical protein